MSTTRGGGSRAGARSEARRRAILDAALECFTTYGYAKTTMEDIRGRARASTGSLYHHFESKEKLAAELYVEGIRSYQQGLLAELERHRSAEHGIRSLVQYHLRWFDENPEWASYLSHSREADFVTATESLLHELNREMFHGFLRWVEPFVEAGEVARMPDDLYGAVLMGPAQNFGRLQVSGRPHSDLATAGRILADCAWAALRGDR